MKHVKIRLQGTTNDIKWFKKKQQNIGEDKKNDCSFGNFMQPFPNKGTKKYFRVWMQKQVERGTEISGKGKVMWK